MTQQRNSIWYPSRFQLKQMETYFTETKIEDSSIRSIGVFPTGQFKAHPLPQETFGGILNVCRQFRLIKPKTLNEMGLFDLDMPKEKNLAGKQAVFSIGIWNQKRNKWFDTNLHRRLNDMRFRVRQLWRFTLCLG